VTASTTMDLWCGGGRHVSLKRIRNIFFANSGLSRGRRRTRDVRKKNIKAKGEVWNHNTKRHAPVCRPADRGDSGVFLWWMESGKYSPPTLVQAHFLHTEVARCQLTLFGSLSPSSNEYTCTWYFRITVVFLSRVPQTRQYISLFDLRL